MNKYDLEYFFILKGDDERLPSLTADKNTMARNYTFEPQPVGSAPLFFFNGAREYDEKMGIPILKKLPEILFNGSNLVVRSRIREELLALDIPNLHIHPAVYIHDDKEWYEDYWFLTFSDQFDCWDRNNSNYNRKPLEMGGFKLHNVYRYSLNQKLLDETQIDQRLLFQMGGAQDGHVVCHLNMLALFSGSNSGASTVSIAAYGR